MFPADTADFYQIFLHIKQIIRRSESQPYIKKQEKSIDNINTNFFRYLSLLLRTWKQEKPVSQKQKIVSNHAAKQRYTLYMFYDYLYFVRISSLFCE